MSPWLVLAVALLGSGALAAAFFGFVKWVVEYRREDVGKALGQINTVTDRLVAETDRQAEVIDDQRKEIDRLEAANDEAKKENDRLAGLIRDLTVENMNMGGRMKALEREHRELLKEYGQVIEALRRETKGGDSAA